jgi:acetaldehyde dehydrogenase (acetylating)
MAIHSQDDHVILEFGLKKPAFRIIVNSPTTHGSIGLTTGLDPAMTLGCGGYGGNITSDNITPRHLLNIKRLAYEIIPAKAREVSMPSKTDRSTEAIDVGVDVLTTRIDRFLGSRGYRPASVAPDAGARQTDNGAAVVVARRLEPPETPFAAASTLDFVCEEDVRSAIRAGRKLIVSERAIVTPAARDLGEEHQIFTVAPWRG